MNEQGGAGASEEVATIIASAARLGIELDEAETLQWLSAMSAQEASELVVDSESGTFGAKVTMLDFSPRELERFRRIGKIVELTGPEETTEGALSISGSAAQSKIQIYPGDADFFQRFNIKVDTREEACRILSESLRAKIISTSSSETYRFSEVKWSSWPFAVTRRGEKKYQGSPMTWNLQEVNSGEIHAEKEDGTPVVFNWEDVRNKPDWVMLNYVVIDPLRKQLASASNVIDTTWESPDGEIVSLDGYLDAYFQEVYLDADAVPVFAKLAKHVSADALEEYVGRIEGEIRKYLTKSTNYGKAAKRMYNVFRLTGRYNEAAFVRELFDEPATILYKVWSLLNTIWQAVEPGSDVPLSMVRSQTDELIMDVVQALEGVEEQEIVKALLRLRETLEEQENNAQQLAQIDAAQTQIVNLINNFFRERLNALPTIKDYMDSFQSDAAAH